MNLALVLTVHAKEPARTNLADVGRHARGPSAAWPQARDCLDEIPASDRSHSEKTGLGDAVDVIVGAEDVREPKPHPEGLLFALARLSVEAPATVFVGDHPVDVEVAARAGTAFVAVRTGVSSTDVWDSWRPLGVIDHVGRLPELLQDRSGRRV